MTTWRKIMILSTIGLASAAHAQNPSPAHDLPEQLQWISCPKQYPRCEGYFYTPKALAAIPNPAPPDEAVTTITANQPSEFSTTHQSTIRGNVTVSQPGRTLKAEQATIYRHPKTNQITHIALEKSVSLQDADKLFIGKKANYDIQNNKLCVWNGGYRINQHRPDGLHSWGTAQNATRDKTGVVQITKSTFSTCSPRDVTWQIRAGKLTMDTDKGKAVARNTTLYIKNIPILYTPYLSFSLNRQRKTGFLLPTIGFNHDDGYQLSIPYYINIAPNYDATITPTYFTRRGIHVNGIFRYLTQHSNGHFDFGFIPKDRGFRTFKKETIASNNTNPLAQPFLSRIDNSSDTRGSIALHNNSQFNRHWQNTIDVNWVSDDYYLQDFANHPISSNTDQLLNRADLLYNDEHWTWLTRVQAHQTLHPIHSNNKNQYSRLPQITLDGDFPYPSNHLNYALSAEFIHFDHRNDFVTDSPVVTGDRVHIRPNVQLPFMSSSAYFTPSIYVDASGYWLHDQPNNTDNSIYRVLPIANIDTGLYFANNFSFLNTHWQQTIEPRAYYLYVPYHNQNEVPLFDTSLPTFNYEQLFHINRFTGYDRIGDANQLALALNTRLLTTDTGAEKLSAGIATLLYFEKRKVCTTPDCATDPFKDNDVSPIISSLKYHVNLAWSASGSWVWDPRNQRTTATSIRVNYHPSTNIIINTGYDFVRDGDPSLGAKSQNLSRVDLGLALPITHKWQLLSNFNYNVSHSHPQSAFIGLEYDSCCIAFRAIASRYIIDNDTLDNAQFDNRYYLQISLKGLATIGNSDPGQLLTSRIRGYQDKLQGY